MSQYIGKTISLISNKGLRYVGLLDNINANDATVALKSVRSLGTEGRMAQNGNPNLEVLPGNDVYDYVVFRGSDVKDLSVLDIPIEQVKPEVPQYFAPPTQTPTPSQPSTTAAAGATTTTELPARAPASAQAPAPTSAPAAASPAAAPAAPTKTSAPSAPPVAPTKTTGENATRAQTQNSAQPQEAPSPGSIAPAPSQSVPQPRPQNSVFSTKSKGVDIPDTAFDFETANARFTKELESQRPQEEGQEVYNKLSSFFDNISSSNVKNNSTMRWDEEKVLNMDTFGQSSVGGRGNWRGRGRGGRGRGGRGNWRGRGGRGKPEPKPEWA